jgi:ribose transport system substrate-binding protein
LPSFTKQGKSIPALATSDGNSLGCFWADNHASNPDFKLFTVATGNDNVRLAVQWAVALATGGEKPKENIFKAPAFEDSVSGKPNAVQCRKDLPGAIYMSSALPAEDQAKAVSK